MEARRGRTGRGRALSSARVSTAGDGIAGRRCLPRPAGGG
jgi:hypothetical protein